MHRAAVRDDTARMRAVVAAAVVLFLCCAPGCARAPMSQDRFSNPDLAPLAAAVARQDVAEIRRQAERIDPDTPGADGGTLLVEAIGRGLDRSVQALLEAGADPNRPGAGGQAPVHAAAFAPDPAPLREVLSHGGDPDLRNPETGTTPLMQAILGRHAEQVALLLRAGADPNLADLKRDTPLHVAARTNDGDTILQLLRRGAQPLARNAGGASFQDYYFSFNRQVLNPESLAHRREIVAWLKAHNVPLAANVEADY